MPQAPFQRARTGVQPVPIHPLCEDFSVNTQNKQPPSDKDFSIKINTHTYKVPGPTISFEDVLRLDSIDTAGQDLSLFDVDWRHGNEVGTLKPDQSVELKNGMRFDAGKSNRS